MTPPRSGRFESLDHCRGLACLLVVIYHSTIVYLASAAEGAAVPRWLSGVLEFTHQLNVGVALFFVISGYCIAAAADAARRRDSGIANYFVRRFRRIYPPFWVAVLFSIALFVLFDYGWSAPLLSREPWPQYRPSWYSASQWIGNLTLTETWRHYLAGGPRGHFPGQAWTLCYEEQFYFVTGMLLLFAKRRFFAGVAVVSLATAAVATVCRLEEVEITGWFFDGAWLLFATGVIVYYRVRYASPERARAWDAALIAIALVSVYLHVPIYGAPVGFLFAAALPWLNKMDASFNESAALRPLRYCGQMCYSLYLVHQIPVKGVATAMFRSGLTGPFQTLLLTMPACVAVSVMLGWTFHLVVERRFLNTPIPQPVAATAPSPQALAGAFG